MRRRKELTHGAWNLYVEYCRHRDYETGRCDVALLALAQALDRTYGHVSDCKAELATEGWLRRVGKNAVELLVGFGPPKVRAAAVNPKYAGRKKSGDKSGKNPEISPENSGAHIRNYKKAVAAAPATAEAQAPPDRATEVCDDAYVAGIKARGTYSPEFVEYVWRKLRDYCAEQAQKHGYPVSPTRRQFDWWLRNELTPPQQALFTGAGVPDVRLGAKSKCGASCPRCFGTGMWHPEGFGKGVARCPGPPAERKQDDESDAGGLKVAEGGGGR
jgi:hypothetical protein